MKLIKLKLKDFRGYKDVEVDFNPNINVLIGRNDVGKSTILDALNIFFNDDFKPDILDCNKQSTDKRIEISACFEIGEGELVIIDASNPTSLKSEYLLNKKNLLEVRKVFNAGGQSISKASLSVFLNAYHPNILEKPLITYKQSELKKVLKEHESGIENYGDISKSKKADMRRAIYDLLIDSETHFEEKFINIKDIEDDGLKTWDKLRDNLPFYTLFQSDRANTDGDKEVQDPMKAITKKVLAELQPQLTAIKDQVVERVEEIGKETIAKLRDFNDEIASQLKTIPDLKSWDTLFKFNLDTDEDIPLNKRGSGVRRLILLSYFRAQAEKNAVESGKHEIIYAIEEPETSQHPDYQRMIIESLVTISKKEKHQVFITTHTPEIAKMVDKDSLILIQKDGLGNPEIVRDEEIKIGEVAKTLGVLPTINSRLVICVEGPNDVNFLRNINESVQTFKQIINLEEEDIGLFPVGGSNLIQWINQDHFRKSNIIEFHLYDGDIPKYKDVVNKMNEENDGRRYGVTTKLREMENYIPISLIESEFQCDLTANRKDWCVFNVPEHLKKTSMSFIKDGDQREIAIKGILNDRLTKRVTAELLKEHGVYEEVEGWFRQISDIYNGAFSEPVR